MYAFMTFFKPWSSTLANSKGYREQAKGEVYGRRVLQFLTMQNLYFVNLKVGEVRY